MDQTKWQPCCVCGRDSPVPFVKYNERVLFLASNGWRNWCVEHAPLRVRILIRNFLEEIVKEEENGKHSG